MKEIKVHAGYLEDENWIFESVFNACEFGFIVLDHNQNIVTWNPWISRHCGYELESALAKPFTGVFPQILGGSLDRAIGVALSHGMSSLISSNLNKKPLPLRSISGALIQQSIKVKPLKRNNGKTFCLIQIHDISSIAHRDKQLLEQVFETKCISQKLAEEKERVQVTLDSIADAVIVTDEKGRIVSMNPVAEFLTGVSEQDAINRSCLDVFKLIDERIQTPVKCPVCECLRQNTIITNDSDHILLSANGQRYAITDSTAPIRNSEGQLFGSVLVFRDVTESRALSAELNWQALHDPLTGLANRREFESRLSQSLEKARTLKQRHYLFYMDLDQFKVVNDTCGHDAGDELLKHIGAIFQQKLRKIDLLARLGGDEFGVLLEGCEKQAALKIAHTMQKAIENYRFIWHSQTFKIGVSIGITEITGKEAKASEILSAADSACYEAKDSGRNRVHFHESDETGASAHQQEMQWISKIQNALDKDQFELYGQCIKSMKAVTNNAGHYEVLIRMRGSNGELIPPGAFLPAAERFHLMSSIDRWVFDNVFKLIDNKTAEELPVFSINFSGMSISNDSLIEHIVAKLDKFPHLSANLCFEVTETAAIANLDKATRFFNVLKEKNCKIALDDFGSGLSSFAYLRRLPIDYLKIDGYFVKGIAEDAIDRTFVETINQIGHAMGLKTIAEFAENDAIIQVLEELGVDYAQGYGVHVPCPLDNILGIPPAI
ncbi:MAG: EAL domain-containing protein [Methylomicrobium sp.]|nr:EAL domain-containing protein [Methylomicrobium sp.]